MAFPERIAIASRNLHKLAEIERICADWSVGWTTVRNADPASFPEVAEEGSTYLENALLKARATASALGLPALADDSGIEVDALGGTPGPRSARYAGNDATDDQNLDALLAALRGVPASGRTARYRCVAVLALPGAGELHAEGVCEGTLVAKRRGSGGFGYDPVFVPVGCAETIAEMSPERKDQLSHRGRALRALRDAVGAT
jgi:XTP/dITP diphosphohydrolase